MEQDMQTTVENLSDVALKVEVELPATVVDGEYAKQLAIVRRQARVKGFRPGKAPEGMVKSMYKTHLASETARVLVMNSISEAIDSLDHVVLGEPSLEPALAVPGSPLRYTMTLQVKPEVVLENWKGYEVWVDPAVVEPEAIDGRIDQIRQLHKEQVPVEGRGAQDGDFLKLDSTGSIDGVADERLSTTDLPVELGKGGFIPGFAEELAGLKQGDEHTFDVTFPDDYFAEELAGKPARFEVTIKEHYVEELPELDDDFAQDADYESLSAMRETLSAELLRAANEQRQREIEDRLVALLLEKHPFGAPPVMVERQAQFQAQQMYRMLAMQGLPPEQAQSMLAGNQESMLREASTTVRRYLAMDALAKAEKIEVSDDEVDAEIATRTEGVSEQVAAEYQKEQARESLRMELAEKAALDLLISHAIIHDSVPEESEAEASDADSDDAEETDTSDTSNES